MVARLVTPDGWSDPEPESVVAGAGETVRLRFAVRAAAMRRGSGSGSPPMSRSARSGWGRRGMRWSTRSPHRDSRQCGGARLACGRGPHPLHREWHGDPDSPRPPLLLIHGGGSTIETNWGLLLPLVAPTRSVLAVELQGHGRTPSGDRPATFEGSADDVAAVLDGLGVGPVDVLGFSNGGQVALQLAARHPSVVRRLIAASAPVRRDAMVDGFWDGLAAGTFDDLPAPYREADRAVSRDPEHARRMFELDRDLMLVVRGLPGRAPRVDHRARPSSSARTTTSCAPPTSWSSRPCIPDARLLIVPGTHGDYLGERLASAADPTPLRRTLPHLLAFLDAP